MEKLSLVLWQERELLDSLLYRLEVEQLVLASGRTTWLLRAAHEVEQTLARLRETEVLRSAAADEAGAELGLGPNPSLRALAEVSREPWSTILLDHREAFVVMTRRVAELAETNRGLITQGYRSAQETLMTLGGEAVQGYTPDGTVTTPGGVAKLVDRRV